MIQSMTGFGNCTYECMCGEQAVTLNVQIKSVNGRFFEANCRLPSLLSHLETRIIKQLKEQLIRGTVTCTITISQAALLRSNAICNYPLAQSYLAALKKIQAESGLNETLTAGDIVNLPGLFSYEEPALDDILAYEVSKALDQALRLLQEERIREGAALLRDLEERMTRMHESVQFIKERSSVVTLMKKEALENAFRELLEKVGHDSADVPFHQLFTQLEKLDVHEELVRLDTHLETLEASLRDKSVEKGKKIDFIVQELFRETNTIAAKCADGPVSQHAISLKVEIEKMREQVSNIV